MRPTRRNLCPVRRPEVVEKNCLFGYRILNRRFRCRLSPPQRLKSHHRRTHHSAIPLGEYQFIYAADRGAPVLDLALKQLEWAGWITPHNDNALNSGLTLAARSSSALKMSGQISKKRKFVADGVFRAELNDFFTRELSEEGYSGCDVRVTHARTEVSNMNSTVCEYLRTTVSLSDYHPCHTHSGSLG